MVRRRVLYLIVISQFFCTSLWFAVNGVVNDLLNNFDLPPSTLGDLTSAVQFGFIIGTFLFAWLALADKYSPSRVFFTSALIGACFNFLILWEGNTSLSLIVLRFLVGFFLAGIYPVGMKIASDYFDKGLGRSMGYIVGALVLGTALPHFIKGFSQNIPWQFGIIVTSVLAITGGTLMWVFVPDGPYRKVGIGNRSSKGLQLFKDPLFRTASYGYFGHMWELYAFWAFIPLMLSHYKEMHPNFTWNISLLSFAIIAVGGLGCVLGGYISEKIGVEKTAFYSLGVSLLCCLISPFMLGMDSSWIFIIYLLIWGFSVIPDSPLFSTMVAQNCPIEVKGSALTLVTSLGFLISILSIQLLNVLREGIDPKYLFLFLCLGPLLGMLAWAQFRYLPRKS